MLYYTGAPTAAPSDYGFVVHANPSLRTSLRLGHLSIEDSSFGQPLTVRHEQKGDGHHSVLDSCFAGSKRISRTSSSGNLYNTETSLLRATVLVPKIIQTQLLTQTCNVDTKHPASMVSILRGFDCGRQSHQRQRHLVWEGLSQHRC